MIDKIKHTLGIESLKIKLELVSPVLKDSGLVDVNVIYESPKTVTVQSINLECIEKYFRGRRKSKLISEYPLGELEVLDTFQVIAGERLVKNYKVPFELLKSEMDNMADSNFVFGGLVGVAKFLKGVKSEYRIEASVKVKGTKLNPTARLVFEMK